MYFSFTVNPHPDILGVHTKKSKLTFPVMYLQCSSDISVHIVIKNVNESLTISSFRSLRKFTDKLQLYRLLTLA